MKHEQGISTVGVLVVLLIVVTLGLGGMSIWSFANYSHQKNDTDAIVAKAVTKAEQAQADNDRLTFLEQEKAPNTTFSGPSDFGSVGFNFPKTWSVYLGNGDDGDNGTYTAYFNPKRVPTINQDTQFAFHILIQNKTYESVIGGYANQVKKGTLKSSPVTTNGLTGVRLDGTFSKTIEGSAVIFKVRDKTLIAQTDSPTFKNDFDQIVLPTLTFTP